MIIGQIIGRVVATKKDSQLISKPLLIAAMFDAELNGFSRKELIVAVDSVGAGVGEIVLITRGSPAMQFENASPGPIDATIVGIIDSMEMQ